MLSIKTALKPHQLEHLKLTTRKKRCVLADKPGKGKSIVALASFAHLCNHNLVDIAFVMGPLKNYTEKVWERECRTHSNINCISLDRIASLSKNKQDIARLIKTRGILIYAKHSHLKSQFNLIQYIFTCGVKVYTILDEFHAFRNPESSLHLRLKAILNTQPTAVIGLSATLLSKSLEDAYTLLDLIKPGVLGTRNFFIDNFCKTEEEVIGRTSFGLRKVRKVVGFSNIELFYKYVDGYLLSGSSTFAPEYHFVTYRLTDEELKVYRRIANGLAHRQVEDESDATWLKNAVSGGEVEVPKTQVLIDEHSSRFIYLQYGADGIISVDGEFSAKMSSKLTKLVEVLDPIIEKGLSCLIYVAYYESLNIVQKILAQRYKDKVKIVEASGRSVLEDGVVTQNTVAKKSHILLATKAGSESVSYFFINQVIFFHTPTVPDTVSQFVGRITRLNTLFPGDLHVTFITANNVDMYKLLLVSAKSNQIELLSGLDQNLPTGMRTKLSTKELKRRLIWNL